MAEKNSFVLYETVYDSFIKAYEAEDYKLASDFMKAVMEYGLFEESDESNYIVAAMLAQSSFGIDRAKDRREKNITDGKKGGRPATKREAAVEYIKQGLSKQDIIAKGISESTYKRAKADLEAQKGQNSGSKVLNQEDNLVQNSMDQEGSKGSKLGQNDFDLEKVKSSKGVQNSFDPRAQVGGYVF